MTVTEERLNEIINGAMSRLFESRDDIARMAQEVKEAAGAALQKTKQAGEVLDKKLVSSKVELAALIGKAQKAQEKIDDIARLAEALSPGLEGANAMIGKRVRLKGGTCSMVAAAMSEDGMVTCTMERFDNQTKLLDIYSVDVHCAALELV